MPPGVPSDTVVAAPGVRNGSTGDGDADRLPAPQTTGTASRSRARGRFAWGLAAIAVAAFGLRAGYVLATRDDTSLCQRLVCGDARYYVRQAGTIAKGWGFIDPVTGMQAADHPPLTALVGAPAAWLFGDEAAALVTQRLVMAAIGSLVVVGVGLLGRRVTAGTGRGDLVGLIAAAIAAVNANLWMNDVVVMSEALAAAGIVATLLAAYRYAGNRTVANAALVGGLVGLSGLARAELLLLGPVMFVPLVVRRSIVAGSTASQRRGPEGPRPTDSCRGSEAEHDASGAAGRREPALRARLAHAGAAAAMAVLVIAPWAAYNLTRFTEPVLMSTNDGLTIAGANCDQMYGLTNEGGTGFWSIGCAFVHEPRIQRDAPGADDSVRSRIYRQIGVDYALDHADRLQAVVEHRLLRGWGFFAPDQTVYLNAREGRAPWASWTGFVQWWLLCVPAVLGARALKRRGVPVWPLASTAVIVTLVLAGFYGLVRFRLAADLAVIVLAAVAIDEAVARARARRAGAPESAGELHVIPTGEAPTAGDGHAPATVPHAGPAPVGAFAAAEPVPASAERRADGRFPCLDAYRGIGMTLILLLHVAYATGFQNRTDGVAALLTPVFARADIGVPMFFVLSGFLLFRPWARAILGERALPSAWSFYRRRVLRIMPSYWFVLALAGVLVGLRLSGAGRWIANALFAPSFGAPVQTCDRSGSCSVGYGLTPAWSIGIEITFYLLLPLFAVAVHRLTRGRPTAVGRWRGLVGALAGVYLAGTALRIFVVSTEPSWASQSLLWLPMYVDLFAIGMALAAVSAADADGHRPLARPAVWAGRHPAACWVLGAAVFGVVILLPHPEQPFALRDASGFSDYVIRQFLYGIAAAAWLAPAMFGDQRAGRLRRALASRPAVYLGTVSLSFYLWHLPIIEKVQEWTVPNWYRLEQIAANPPAGNPLAAASTFVGSLPRVAVISWVLTLLVAGLLYRFVELPFLRLKDAPLRDLLRRPPRAGPAGADPVDAGAGWSGPHGGEAAAAGGLGAAAARTP